MSVNKQKISRNSRIVVLISVLLVAHTYGQTTLQVVWMVPYTSHPESSFKYNASSSVAALALGIKTVQDKSLLPNHVFK